MNEDISSERAVLGGVAKYGYDGYIDVSDIVTSKTFTEDINQVLWRCYQYLFETQNCQKIDLPIILSAGKSLGCEEIVTHASNREYIRSVLNFNLDKSNLRKLAIKIRNLEITRLLYNETANIQKNLLSVTGDERLFQILGMAEEPILNFTSLLESNEDVKKLSSGLKEWIDYLVENPVTSIGVSTGYPEYDEAIGGGLRDGTVSLVGAITKGGKAQPLNSIIYTPNGPKKMGDIKEGDIVCTPNGCNAKVIAIHPQGKKPVFRVYFRDGEYAECCEDHLWEIYQEKQDVSCIMSTKTLIDKKLKTDRRKFGVKLTKPVIFNEQNVPLDPYLMGLLLGDGCLKYGCDLTNTDKEIIDYFYSFEDQEYKVKYNGANGYRLTLRNRNKGQNKYITALRNLNLFKKLSADKFIPDVYKYNTVEVRLSILQGLMDTDGYTSSKKALGIFYSKSQHLVNDVKEIAESLGYLCVIKNKTTYCNNKICHSFACYIKGNDITKLFRITRKKNKAKIRSKKNILRKIDRIERVDDQVCQCVTLNTSDGLYLTNNFIVTHNSMMAINVALFIADKLNIPVFLGDTEMKDRDQWSRILACMTGIPYHDIEKGTFANNPTWKVKVYNAIKRLDEIPLYYGSFIDMPIDEIIPVFRRWLIKDVKKNNRGVIIFDYIKVSTSEEIDKGLQEYQKLGFYVSALHNFCAKHNIPCLAFAQLNRDKEIASSHRQLWGCSNFSQLLIKEMVEQAESGGPQFGNRKLVPVMSRQGGCLEPGDYINFMLDGKVARLKEGKRRNTIKPNDPLTGFENVDAIEF